MSRSQTALIASGAMLIIFGTGRLAGYWLRAMPSAIAIGIVGGGLIAIAGSFAVSGAPTSPTNQLKLESLPTAAPSESEQTTDPLQSATPTTRTIEGTLVDFDSKPLATAIVTLNIFEGTTPVGTEDQLTDTQGRFSFRSSDGNAYVVKHLANDTEFLTDVLVGNSIVELSVGPTTSEESVLTTLRDSTVMSGDSNGIQIVQVLELEVAGDSAFAGGIELPIHLGASDFVVLRGIVRQRLEFDTESIRYAAPIIPGRTELVYQYLLASPENSATLKRVATTDVKTMELLATGDLELFVTKQAEGFEKSEDVKLGTGDATRTYSRLVATDVARGSELVATIELQRAFPIGLATAIGAGLIALGFVFRPNKAKLK